VILFFIGGIRMYRPSIDYDLMFAFDEGVKRSATHMFVMHQHMGCSGGRNEFCQRHFYVMPGENLNVAIAKQAGTLMDIYDLSQPRDKAVRTHTTDYETMHEFLN